MSLRSEVVRLGLRAFLKPNDRRIPAIADMRRQTAMFERCILPLPPRAAVSHDGLGGCAALRIVPRSSRSGRHILFLHGGGYVTGSLRLYRTLGWRLAEAADAQVAIIDYRLAPEHPFPAALDDAVAAWRALLAEGAVPSRAIVMGDSAGGGLALALGLRLRDLAEPLPAALVALSPWTDLAATGESLRRNAKADPLLHTDGTLRLAAHYLNGANPRDPYASPLYGDHAGLPPTLIQVGSDEILRDNSVRIAERMRGAGCDVEIEIWPRMPHVWHAFGKLIPEAPRAIARIGDYLRKHTPTG